MIVTAPIQAPTEPCGQVIAEATSSFDAPSALIESTDPNSVRLIPSMRSVAKTRDAKTILTAAAFEYYCAWDSSILGLYPGLPLRVPSIQFAQGLADLAVTGRAAYDSFQQLAPSEADLLAPVLELVKASLPSHQPVQASVSEAVRTALQRAYQVAWALRGPTGHRKAQRPALQWIAVDGEDDPPHRPVNVPSALYPQYNLTVQVNSLAVTTRFVVASRRIDDSYHVDTKTPPLDQSFPLIDTDVIIFIHGHSSSLEEALPLIGPLLQQAQDRGRPVTLIAMDLPSNGYASMLEHTAVAPPEASQWNTGYPILDFIENFIVAFVDALDVRQPGIKRQIIGVIGGSLGGNVTLRLGRRDPATHPWLHSLVSWSPASTWESWARATLGETFSKYRYPSPIHHEGVNRTRGAMMEPEVEPPYSNSSLNKFFYEKAVLFFDVGRKAQAEHWYRKNWPCREAAMTESHRSIYEIYNANFRRWHWRIAHEQLIFSHWDSDNPDPRIDPDPRLQPAAGPARYSTIKSRILLAAGTEDDLKPEHIYRHTKALASSMTMVNGSTLFIEDTGHSMAVERPLFFSGRILDFLFVTPSSVTPSSSAQQIDISHLTLLLLGDSPR